VIMVDENVGQTGLLQMGAERRMWMIAVILLILAIWYLRR